ncbi:hypothetical protein [Pseudomonas sp. PP3]|uniref:hypothetical protein n=1 Tax=Pseudomonas sp. PP3 TaxID=2815936 RepID=UPI001BAEFCBA|nr:hypothetical protein [Pseudomonas sp. PP3]
MSYNSINGFRGYFCRNLQPICFLVAYFVLVVLGNLIYASPFGLRAIEAFGYPVATLKLNHIFTLGYWVLLFMPFVVTPMIVFLVKKTSVNLVECFAKKIPEMTKAWLIVLFSLSCIFVLSNFYKCGVFEIFQSGKDSVSSVEARFEIRERLHFGVFIVIQAIVPYLSYVAVTNLSKKGGAFWYVFSLVSILIASSFFVMINMKWPVVLYYVGVVLTIFVHTEKYAYTKAVVGGLIVIATYLLISTVVFRLAPEPMDNSVSTASAIHEKAHIDQHQAGSQEAKPPKLIVTEIVPKAIQPGGTNLAVSAERAAVVSEAAISATPMLMMHLLSRMSIVVPYYYQEFTDHPSACGGILAQARPGPVCRPSTYIYNKLFVSSNDQFIGLGTSPAAVHITGYAVGGWTVAIFALLCASVILGVLSCIPVNASSTVSAFGIVGALAGYHFSQIPGEGVIFYEHGLFWPFLLMAGYTCAVWLFNSKTMAAESAL